MSDALHHNLIALPTGKTPDMPVAERHDLVLLFDCEKSNPNGDPDTGNMPRLQPDSLKGLVTDVCLKRKIRNFFSLNQPNGQPLSDAPSDGYRIFIRESAILQQSMEQDDVAKLAEEIFNGYTDKEKGKWKRPAKNKEGKEGRGETEFIQRAYRDALCKSFFDLRTFGGVISTSGPLQGTFYGQVRGPVQFTFSESLDKVLQIDSTITRCAVASEKEKKQAAAETEEAANRTMGRKHGIDYGLYLCQIHFSPAFAAKTRFTYYDLDNFLFALKHMFTDDHAAGRHLRLVGLVDFQHQSSLGNAPAHKLFKLVKVQGNKDDNGKFKSSGSEFPRCLDDYCGNAPDGPVYQHPDGSFSAIKPPKEDGNEPVSNVTARKLVWEFPKASTDGKQNGSTE